MAAVRSTYAPASGTRLAANSVRLLSTCTVAFALFALTPAQAEISSEVKLQTDDRFRGRSLSDGRPVIDGDISIDLASGIYAGGSVAFILTGKDRAGLQGVDAYLGYAALINEEVTVDLGIAGYRFTQRYSGNNADQYAEIYAGLSADGFAAYVHYTPNYFDKSVPVIYADLNFARAIDDHLTVKAHAGLLAQTSGPARLGRKSARYDTRLSISRPVLGFQAEFAWTYAGRNDGYFAGPWNGNSAIIFSISKHF